MKDGRIYRHYLLHQNHSLALAERRKDANSDFEDFFCYEMTSFFTKTGGCIALWVNSSFGMKELVDGDQGLEAFTVAADLTLRNRLSDKYRLWAGQTACAAASSGPRTLQLPPSSAGAWTENLLRGSSSSVEENDGDLTVESLRTAEKGFASLRDPGRRQVPDQTWGQAGLVGFGDSLEEEGGLARAGSHPESSRDISTSQFQSGPRYPAGRTSGREPGTGLDVVQLDDDLAGPEAGADNLDEAPPGEG